MRKNLYLDFEIKKPQKSFSLSAVFGVVQDEVLKLVEKNQFLRFDEIPLAPFI